MNVPQKQQSQTLAHSLYSSSKIAVEFEDEEGLKELCLELRELEEEVRSVLPLVPQNVHGYVHACIRACFR